MSAASPSRILHVLDHSLPVASGYAYRSRSILCAQRRLGLEPIVLTSPKQGDTLDTCEILDGIPHHRTGQRPDRPPVIGELCLMAHLARRIRHVARTERVGVIHAHSPLLNGLPALWAGRQLGLRVVYEVRTFWEDAAVSHGTHTEGSLRYRASRALETVVLRRTDAVVSICQGIRSEVIARGVPPGRVVVIPNGVDPEWLRPRPRALDLAARLGVGDGPVFGYVGSFSHYEGLPFLVRAMPELLTRIPTATLVLAGSGRDEATVAEAARRVGLAVRLIGRIPQEQVPDLYTLLTALVLPRRRLRLTELVTPLKPLEGMAAGVPVLASDVGGHNELIADGQTGLLFKAESRDSLVEQAARLACDEQLRRDLVDNARRWVRNERMWDRIVTGYLPIYRGPA